MVTEIEMGTSEEDPFREAGFLIGYMEIHAGTQLALVHIKHLAQLAYLAGYDIPDLTPDKLEIKDFRSLHDYGHLIKEARERFNEGLISDNWYAEFEESMRSNAKI